MTTINQSNRHYQFNRLNTLLKLINENTTSYTLRQKELTKQLNKLYTNTNTIYTAPLSFNIETIILELININKKLKENIENATMINSQLSNIRKMLNISINQYQIINCHDLENNLI